MNKYQTDFERLQDDTNRLLEEKQRVIDDKNRLMEDNVDLGINRVELIGIDNDQDEKEVRFSQSDDESLYSNEYNDYTDDSDESAYLETACISEIKDKETFFELIKPFPKKSSIDKNGEFVELKSWLYNTIDAINIWHLLHEKPKLDYIKCMRYLSFKIGEITLYYYDHLDDYKEMKIDKTHKTTTPINDKRNKLLNWRNSSQEHIQSLLNEYPSRFSKKTDDDAVDMYTSHSIWCCKKDKFDEIGSIKHSLENMQLTEDQYRIFKYDYMNKLIYLDRRKRKFKKFYCFSNTSLQIGSVILPALITIKDNTNIEDIKHLEKILDISAILLSVLMGIITNLTVFFKVNQRYSLYTQYDNKLKQEMRRFITYSEKYNDKDVDETYRLFPQFSSAIENYIEELSNQEYDYIVSNKEKDNSANVKEIEINSLNKEDGSKYRDHLNSRIPGNNSNEPNDSKNIRDPKTLSARRRSSSAARPNRRSSGRETNERNTRRIDEGAEEEDEEDLGIVDSVNDSNGSNPGSNNCNDSNDSNDSNEGNPESNESNEKGDNKTTKIEMKVDDSTLPTAES